MKGILFKPWKVKPIGEMMGDDTMATRRVIKPQPSNLTRRIVKGKPHLEYWYEPDTSLNIAHVYNPRYKVGEVVYVKEAWATDKMFDTMTPHQIEETKVATIPLWYRYDDQQLDNPNTTQGRWRSPLFMPEWATRRFTEIVGVRPERLQEITEEDAQKEDAPYIHTMPNVQLLYPNVEGYRRGFLFIWNEIHPDYPWESNPWVWRYEFKRIEKI